MAAAQGPGGLAGLPPSLAAHAERSGTPPRVGRGDTASPAPGAGEPALLSEELAPLLEPMLKVAGWWGG